MLTTMLKPASQLLGFAVNALDGEIGKLEDFMICDTDFAIRYLVVTLNYSGERFLLSPWWVERADWESRTMFLGFTLKEICESSHDAHLPVSSRSGE